MRKEFYLDLVFWYQLAIVLVNFLSNLILFSLKVILAEIERDDKNFDSIVKLERKLSSPF